MNPDAWVISCWEQIDILIRQGDYSSAMACSAFMFKSGFLGVGTRGLARDVLASMKLYLVARQRNRRDEWRPSPPAAHAMMPFGYRRDSEDQ